MAESPTLLQKRWNVKDAPQRSFHLHNRHKYASCVLQKCVFEHGTDLTLRQAAPEPSYSSTVCSARSSSSSLSTVSYRLRFRVTPAV